jgi:membrane protease subunit HflC
VKTSFFGGAAAIVLIAVAILAYASLYTVPQTQFALPLRLGEPKQPKLEPGLYVKAPFIDNIIYIDKRILDLDTPPQEVIANDQKRLVVDAFARYRVTDPLRFFQSLGSIQGAELRLNNIMNSAVRRVLGQASFLDVVREDRARLMGRIKDEVNREASGFGVEIADVRIRRADLPEANSQAVFQRMQTERQREAAQFRAEGSEQAQRIRAESDRSVARILGEANGAAEQIRGSADAERSRLFAEAYSRDPDFFAFFRSLQAYTESMKPSQSRFVLTPDSDFFRYLRSPDGGARPAASPPAAGPGNPATSSAPGAGPGPANPAAARAGPASPATASPAPASPAPASPATASPAPAASGQVTSGQPGPRDPATTQALPGQTAPAAPPPPAPAPLAQ